LNGRSAGRSIGRSDDRTVRSMMSIVSSNVKGCFSDLRAAADTIIESTSSTSLSLCFLIDLLDCTRSMSILEISAQLIDCVSIRLSGLAFFSNSQTGSADQSTIDQPRTVVALRGFGRAKRWASRHPHWMDRFRPVQRSS